LDRELEIARPNRLADDRPNASRGHVILEARARAAREIATPIGETIVAKADAVFVLRSTMTERVADLLIGRRVARDDIVRAAMLRQRDLDAGAGGLARFDEDVAMRVADDHQQRARRAKTMSAVAASAARVARLTCRSSAPRVSRPRAGCSGSPRRT